MLKKIIVFLAMSFIIICTLMGGTYLYVKNNIYEENNLASEDNGKGKEEENIDDVKYEEVEGITNVLLIGSDEREGEEGARSDSMIIATLDNNNKNIKLTSLYRDTLVNIPGYGEEKLNSAYQLGGVNLLIKTIEDNYKIAIKDYITINFNGFEEVIDEVGGIEIDVKEHLLSELNKYIGESTGGNDCPVNESGPQLLNGKQALAYARIRYNCGDDYERAERQREVLVKIAEKIKETNPIKYLGIGNVMLKYIKTDIDPIDAVNMAYTIYSFDKLEIKQISIPILDITKDMEYKDYGSVLITDLEQNAKILNRFIYKNTDSDEITLTYDKILSLIMEYEAVQRSYVHGNNYNEEYNYSNENNNYVNESEEEPLYNMYDGNEYYYFE